MTRTGHGESNFNAPRDGVQEHAVKGNDIRVGNGTFSQGCLLPHSAAVFVIL